MTTEERIQKEAEGKYQYLLTGDLTRNILIKLERNAYIAGATIEAAMNKENAIAFNRWYVASDWSLDFDPNDCYLNVETSERKTMHELYDLFINEQNKNLTNE